MFLQAEYADENERQLGTGRLILCVYKLTDAEDMFAKRITDQETAQIRAMDTVANTISMKKASNE